MRGHYCGLCDATFCEGWPLSLVVSSCSSPLRNKTVLDIRNHLRRRFRPLSRPPLISVAPALASDHSSARSPPSPVAFYGTAARFTGCLTLPQEITRFAPAEAKLFCQPAKREDTRGLANLFGKTRASGLWRYKVKPLAFVPPAFWPYLRSMNYLAAVAAALEGSSGQTFLPRPAQIEFVLP